MPSQTTVAVTILLPVLIIAVSVPLVLGRIKPNQWYGVRTRKTLHSTAVWYKANRFGGICLIVSTLVALVVWAVLSAFPLGLLRFPVYLGVLGACVLVGCIVTLLRIRSL